MKTKLLIPGKTQKSLVLRQIHKKSFPRMLKWLINKYAHVAFWVSKRKVNLYITALVHQIQSLIKSCICVFSERS